MSPPSSSIAVRSRWSHFITLLPLFCLLAISIVAARGDGGQTGLPHQERTPSVTSGSITTVDKVPAEPKIDASSDDGLALPTLSNGHLGFTVFEDAVYMVNLFNGAGGLSHRARIPNVANVRLDAGCYTGTGCDPACKKLPSLRTREGLFRVESVVSGSHRVVHRVFPHALHRRLIVNLFLIERLSQDTTENIELPLSPPVPFTSSDIQFQPVTSDTVGSSSTERIHERCGHTVEVENRTYQPETRPVCVVWNHVPERLSLAVGERKLWYRFVMSVDESVVGAREALRNALLQPAEELLRAHTSLWHSFWARTDIVTAGNGPLQRTVRASIFYLVSNFPLRRPPMFDGRGPGGLSPTGLGRGGGAAGLDDYEGHSFWDAEIWMLPVLNLLDPAYARQQLDYRARMLPVARELAAESGYSGARYPWESAYTGVEVTQPCCPEVATFQHHITGDVSFALRQHLAVTQDLTWMQSTGCRMAQEIADFWASRLSFNLTDSGQYDIAAVMGPDEDHENVTNNAYTNVVAGYALYFGEFANCICTDGSERSRDWSTIARRIKLPYDATQDYHPQFEGYRRGTVIKQADTVLLGFPLQYGGMRPSTRCNDLRTYEAVTRPSGPAMTWAMHAISHLDLGELDLAAKHFNRSYQPYVRGPFHVWHELQLPRSGAQNFLTGAGGFLQAVLFGYGGIRLHLDRLELRPAMSSSPLELPPGCTAMTVKGLQYLGALITVVKTVHRTEVTVTHLEIALTLAFAGEDVSIDITANETYYLHHNRTAIIRAKRYPYRGCHLPEDLIGEVTHSFVPTTPPGTEG